MTLINLHRLRDITVVADVRMIHAFFQIKWHCGDCSIDTSNTRAKWCHLHNMHTFLRVTTMTCIKLTPIFRLVS